MLQSCNVFLNFSHPPFCKLMSGLNNEHVLDGQKIDSMSTCIVSRDEVNTYIRDLAVMTTLSADRSHSHICQNILTQNAV